MWLLLVLYVHGLLLCWAASLALGSIHVEYKLVAYLPQVVPTLTRLRAPQPWRPPASPRLGRQPSPATRQQRCLRNRPAGWLTMLCVFLRVCVCASECLSCVPFLRRPRCPLWNAGRVTTHDALGRPAGGRGPAGKDNKVIFFYY